METNGGVRILIDTPPELRLQLINAGVSQVDAILFTHDHADHVHGIDDIRALSDKSDMPIEMYGPPDSMARLAKRFAYIFDDSIKALPGTSKPEGSAHSVPAGKSFRIGDVEVMPVSIPHGPVSVYGYRIGNLGYITDAKEIALGLARAGWRTPSPIANPPPDLPDSTPNPLERFRGRERGAEGWRAADVAHPPDAPHGAR